MRRTTFVAAVALCLATGCSLLLGDDNTPDPGVDGGGDPSTCQCPETAPFCADDDVCVATCDEASEPDDQCAAREPATVCARHQCLECGAHADCASGACDIVAGVCLSESEPLFYVSDQGSGDACTKDMPCAEIASAITAITEDAVEDAVIAVSPGTYQAAIDANNVRGLRIIAHGALLRASQPSRARGGGSVQIEGLTVSATLGGADLYALVCEGAATRLRMIEVSISSSNRRAFRANCNEVLVERGVIRGNLGGGLDFESTGTVRVHSSLIADNGGGNLTAGDIAALLFRGTTAASVTFSTIVDNVQGLQGSTIDTVNHTGTADFAGVIVRGRAGDNEVIDCATCSFASSNVAGNAGGTNIDEPALLDGDYRPLAGNPGQNVDDLSAQVLPGDLDLDLFGRATPPDMGAFELR